MLPQHFELVQTYASDESAMIDGANISVMLVYLRGVNLALADGAELLPHCR